jgi:hypothetical protein
MKPKAAATRRKPARRTKPRKAVRIHLAGRVTSFFKGKNSIWNTSLNRAWSAAFGRTR